MDNPPIDEYIDKLNITPPETNQKLRLIRKLDQKVLALQIKIDAKREETLNKVMQYEEKKNMKLKAEIEEMLKQINNIHMQMLDFSKEKMELAENIYNFIDDLTEDLDKYLTNHPPPEDPLQHPGRKISKFKRGKKENEWDQQIGEPHYCYCRRPSFGIMVMCDNPFCETEWFHTECLDERNPNDKEKWYCKQCMKGRIKIRSNR